MNKTVTINISGIIFHIEEEAFDKLSKYLSTIKGYFSKADGGNEIMSDIEARIAEMLQGKTSAIKQVVLMADVEYVIESMGKPEEFAEDTQEKTMPSDNTETFETNEQVKKRLYRDADNKVLGGVCSGVGHYFDFDPVWLRIALALLFFFGGTGFLLYLILWIAIPEAKTTAEKLAMKGEKADINNISKAVKEEAEQLKKRMEKYGSDIKNAAVNNKDLPRNTVEKIVDFLSDVFMNLGKVMLKIIGVLMVIFGVIFFLGLFSTVFGASFMTNNVEIQEWIDMFLMDGGDFYLALTGIVLFFGTPIIMMIYGGVKILFKLNYSNRWINLSAGIVWVIGFFILLTVGLKTANDFSKETKVREKIEVKPYDVLYLKLNEVPVDYNELHLDAEYDEEDEHKNRKHHDDYMLGKHNGIKYLLGHAKLNIIKSQTDRMEIVVAKEAKANDKEAAVKRAKNISYYVNQNDSVIIFDDLFKVNDADKFRFQDVNVILKLPVNKVVYLDESLRDFIYDVENTTNTYDKEMINRRWIMTEYGLKCVDCEGINNKTELNDDEEVKINVNGVKINAKDANVKMDSNGVKINSKDTKVTIDKNGVHIVTDENKK